MSSIEPPLIPPLAEATDKDEKPPVLLIAVNAIVLLLIDTILIFVVPVFAEMFSGFGEMPFLTEGLINLAAFLKGTPFLFNPLVIVTVGAGVFLSRDHPSRSLLKWAVWIQILILVAMGISMSLPLFLLGAVAEGL